MSHCCGGNEVATTTETTLNIEGMTCAHCAGSVQRKLAALPGVKDVTVDLASKKAVVSYVMGKSGLDDFKKAVADAGYKVV